MTERRTETIWKGIRAAASIVDDALASVASLPLDRLHEESHRRAMRNREFAGIVTTNESSDAGVVAWRDSLARLETRDAVGPHPWWETPLSALTRRPTTTAVRSVQFAWQRLTRGWDDSATWSLDIHLAATLSAQLQHLADTTHGWPSEIYPEFADWQSALRENAAKLRGYAEGRFGLADEPGGDPGSAYEDMEFMYAEAQDALRWVSEHFGYLWD